MSLIRCNQKQYDPFKDLLDLEHPHTALSLFPNLNQYLNGGANEGFNPAIDISEDKDNIVIKADLPGLKKEDVSVNIEDNILTLRGERKSETESKEKNYHRVERFYGRFERSFNLGTKVDEAHIKAVYKDGVLEVTLPKVAKNAAKQISIEHN